MRWSKKISAIGIVFCLSLLTISYVSAEEYVQSEIEVKQSGWLESDGSWSYVNASGVKQTGWLDLNGTWYYLNENGVMQTGWLNLNSTWYYLNENGVMQTGWLNLNGMWCYLNDFGVMQSGWINVAGVGYYLDGDGIMATNTIIEGWRIDRNGVATPILSTGSYPKYQKEILERVNIERAKYNIAPLTLNVALSNVAMIKSEDMVELNYYAHYSPIYGSPFEMMDLFGLKYWTASENIAMGQRTPESVMNAWMNSPGHRANILDEFVTEIGIGIAVNSSGRYYWTQMFIGNQFWIGD